MTEVAVLATGRRRLRAGSRPRSSRRQPVADFLGYGPLPPGQKQSRDDRQCRSVRRARPVVMPPHHESRRILASARQPAQRCCHGTHRRYQRSGLRYLNGSRRPGCRQPIEPGPVINTGAFVELDRTRIYAANAPATAPLMQVASVPEMIERSPSCTTSARRSGIMAPIPPIMIPALPKFANPQSA